MQEWVRMRPLQGCYMPLEGHSPSSVRGSPGVHPLKVHSGSWGSRGGGAAGTQGLKRKVVVRSFHLDTGKGTVGFAGQAQHGPLPWAAVV